MADHINAQGWEQVCEYATQKRSGHAALVWDNRMFAIQGYDGSSYLDNIGVSKDGQTWEWQETTPSTPPKRAWGKAVAFNGAIYYVGGYNGSVYYNDCWKSADGVEWERITNTVWPNGLGRYGHELVVFNGRMWLLGGRDTNGYVAQVHPMVLSSVDGVTWTVELSAQQAPFFGRGFGAAAVFDNRIFYTGGFDGTNYYRDVYSTADGREWDKLITTAPWATRAYHSLTVFDSKLVLIGGMGSTRGSADRKDLWYTTSGTKWYEGESTIGNDLFDHGAVKFDNALFLFFGDDGTARSGVVLRSRYYPWLNNQF